MVNARTSTGEEGRSMRTDTTVGLSIYYRVCKSQVAEFTFGFHVVAVPVTDTDNLNDYRLVLHKTFVYPGYRRAVRTLRPGSTKRVKAEWLAA